MPYTPFHFGLSGFAGLTLRRWIDAPVFVLANVMIDMEVAIEKIWFPGGPEHQLLHFHTLLIGGAVGTLFGLMMYVLTPLRELCIASMKWTGFPYTARLGSMVLAGLLGAWFHLGVDSYHHDAQLFWPFMDENPVCKWLIGPSSQSRGIVREWVINFCLLGWVLLFVQVAWSWRSLWTRRTKLVRLRRFRRLRTAA